MWLRVIRRFLATATSYCIVRARTKKPVRGAHYCFGNAGSDACARCWEVSTHGGSETIRSARISSVARRQLLERQRRGSEALTLHMHHLSATVPRPWQPSQQSENLGR